MAVANAVSNGLIEQYVDVVKQRGLNTNKNTDLGGTLDVGGAAIFDSTVSVTGAMDVTGLITGFKKDVQIYLTEATATLTVAESSKVVIATKASATQTFTLPIATTEGLSYTFIAGSAAGEILVTPNAADAILIKATVDQGASVAPAAGTGIKNTAATNVLGDMITLVADGVSKWYMVGQSGIWASQ